MKVNFFTNIGSNVLTFPIHVCLDLLFVRDLLDTFPSSADTERK
jgi:hypothetical protein